MANAASNSMNLGKMSINQRTRRIVMGILIFVAIYLLAVTPARTWWEQRQEMNAAAQRYEVLKSANEDLTSRAEELRKEETIEVIARDRYELVPAGKTAYAVMPVQGQQSALNAEDEASNTTWWSKTLDTVTFWN